jgi:predicted O-linked N-acetylglucosamine transferase (SPINDLY family)
MFSALRFFPPIGPSESEAKSITTFGSFNNLAKICDATLSLWSSILHEVKNSEILIKTHALSDSETRKKFSERARLAGIDPDRLVLEGPSPHADLLKSYLRVDVALDPLAYSGGLTTLEALWMGTPVVTLPGDTFARRHSLSHLSVAGLREWVARSPEHYVQIAAQLAAETGARGDFRKWLRGQMAASPTSDASTYARDFSQCLRNFMN